MKNLLINERDRNFILNEMLEINRLFETENYGMFSSEEFEMAIDSALKLAWNELYPTLKEADEKGCIFDNGDVHVPEVFHRVKKLVDDNGWSSLLIPQQYGGGGFSTAMYMSCVEPFSHNLSFFNHTNLPMGAALFISLLGSEGQKKKYLKNLVSGRWGGPVTVNEADAGTDIMSIKTRARRMPNGSYRLIGTKTIVTNGEADLYSNMIYIVMARVDEAPKGIGGLSLFIVPKFIVDENETKGKRNDYSISGLIDKMGLKGCSAVSAVHFGENDDCYAEILGAENHAIPMFMPLLQRAHLMIGLACTGMASSAYLHAVKYAEERIQGANIAEYYNPDAKKIPIIKQPDVRRMILWMKSHVEGMRSLVYYCAIMIDQLETQKDETEKARTRSLLGILVTVCRVCCSDIGFQITETAMQVYGASGYFKDNPIEQFMRNIKPASIYEGPNGMQALQLVTAGMGKNGEHFTILINEMSAKIEPFVDVTELKDLADDINKKIQLLVEIGLLFVKCAGEGKLIVPIVQAYPFIKFLGIIVLGWLLFLEAGISQKKLENLYINSNISEAERNQFISENNEAGFYYGKITTSRFYIKNVLPQADGVALAIKNGDLSLLEIPDNAF